MQCVAAVCTPKLSPVLPFPGRRLAAVHNPLLTVTELCLIMDASCFFCAVLPFPGRLFVAVRVPLSTVTVNWFVAYTEALSYVF